MLVRNPKIEEDLDALNVRIANGLQAIEKAEIKDKERYTRALEKLKQKRRIMNKALQVQISLLGHIFDPEKAFELVQLFQSYCREKFYNGRESLFLDAEKALANSKERKTLLTMYDHFGLDYDYENVAEFYQKIQELLILTLDYILAIDKEVSRK